MPDVDYIVRRSADSGAKLSTSTIIIIAVVSGSVLVLVFTLFAWRLLVRYCRSERTVPLPPAQDLAHRREQQLATLADRSTLARPVTWADHKLVQPHSRLYSSHLLSTSASSASLIRSSPDFTASHGPTRESSWAVEDSISAESSPHPTPSSDLAPPNPSFLPGDSALAHNSMASVASSFSDAVSDVNASGPMTPSDFDPSLESTPSLVHSSSARPRPPRTSRSRPISMVSASGTMLSIQNSQSTNTLRGPPHSIHSNIQIVLPAPLAPDLYPYQNGGAPFERASSFYGGGGDSSRSIADPWVMAGSRPQSIARLNREASSGSRMSSLGPRRSSSRQRSGLYKVASSSSLAESDSASTKVRRAQSQPPVPSTPSVSVYVSAPSRSRTPSPGPPSSRPSSFVPLRSPLPPVPRIPSMYGRPGPEAAEHYSNSNQSHTRPPREPLQPSHGRGRNPAPVLLVPVANVAAPAPEPMAILQAQAAAFAPSPSLPQSSARTGVPPSSGKLRKNRASTQGSRT